MYPIMERIKKIYLSCVEVFCGRDRVMKIIHIKYPIGSTVWDLLAAEGKYDLISKLHKIEQGEPGYSTVIIPQGGWSESADTNDAILLWLKKLNINVWSPTQEVVDLKRALG